MLCHHARRFTGPVDDFHTAEEHLNTLTNVSKITKGVDLHKTFADGDDAAVVYDLVTESPVETARIAEWKTIRGGKISEIRAYFDSKPWLDQGF